MRRRSITTLFVVLATALLVACTPGAGSTAAPGASGPGASSAPGASTPASGMPAPSGSGGTGY